MKRIKIKSRADYVKILLSLRNIVEYVHLVYPHRDGDGEILVRRWKKHFLRKRGKLHQWPGTLTYGRSTSTGYLYQYHPRMLKDLLKFESFFFTWEDPLEGERVKMTNFSDVDISFYDKDKKIVFYTVTHEGIAKMSSSAYLMYKERCPRK